MSPKNNIIIALVCAGVIAMSYHIDANPAEFVKGIPNLSIVLKEMAEVEPDLFGIAFWSMLETIEMAFIGTVVGVAIALPLSMLAA